MMMTISRSDTGGGLAGRVLSDPCLACGAVERTDASTADDYCATCRAPRFCPPGEFPIELRRYLTRRLLEQTLAFHGGGDIGWRHLLAMTFRNSTIDVPGRGQRFLDFAASPDEVYGVACRLAGMTFTDPTKDPPTTRS